MEETLVLKDISPNLEGMQLHTCIQKAVSSQVRYTN